MNYYYYYYHHHYYYYYCDGDAGGGADGGEKEEEGEGCPFLVRRGKKRTVCWWRYCFGPNYSCTCSIVMKVVTALKPALYLDENPEERGPLDV